MQRSSQINWQRYAPEGERWFGFSCVRELVGVPPEILIVPLAGHTLWHCGIAVRGPDRLWLLHAGDAYFFRGEMDLRDYHCTPMLRFCQGLMAADNETRLGEPSPAARVEARAWRGNPPVLRARRQGAGSVSSIVAEPIPAETAPLSQHA